MLSSRIVWRTRSTAQPFFPVPKFALKSAFGELADYMFASLRAMPEATKQSGFEFTYPELGGALSALLQED